MNGCFIHVFPMVSKSSTGDSLAHFIQDVGIPDVVVVDNAPELTGHNSNFAKICWQYKIKQKQTEPFMP